MKTTAYLLALWVLTALCGCHGAKTDDTAAQPVDTVPMMVMQIQQCSRLYTAEYKVRKIVMHNDERALRGRLMGRDFSLTLPGGTRAVAIPIDATVKAYIDFSQFSAANVSRHGRRVEITLPDPEVVLTSTRIDHDAVRQHVPLLRSRFTDAELTALERQGRQAIVKSIPDLGIVATARENAASLLIPIIEQMGFNRDDITITFRKDFGPATILKQLTQTHSDHVTAQ